MLTGGKGVNNDITLRNGERDRGAPCKGLLESKDVGREGGGLAVCREGGKNKP